jgi:hypothetical protein
VHRSGSPLNDNSLWLLMAATLQAVSIRAPSAFHSCDMSSISLSDYEVRQLLRARAGRVHRLSTPAVPVSIARHLAELDLVLLPASPATHHLEGSVQITGRGLAELNRRFLFCCAELCDGILHDRKNALPELVCAHDADIGDRFYMLDCPECGAANVLSATTHPGSPAQITVHGVLLGSASTNAHR